MIDIKRAIAVLRYWKCKLFHDRYGLLRAEGGQARECARCHVLRIDPLYDPRRPLPGKPEGLPPPIQLHAGYEDRSRVFEVIEGRGKLRQIRRRADGKQ